MAEALARGEVERLWLLEGASAGSLRELASKAEERGVPVESVPERYIRSRIGNNPHQGVLAEVRPFGYSALGDVLAEAGERLMAGRLGPATVLLLDGLEDPGNFGGILRTAAGLGIAGVVVPERRCARVTAAVRKASAGTVGRIPVARVVNLRHALERLKQQGWWSAAASASGETDLREMPDDVPLAVVVGSEHGGVGPALAASCDYRVRIPMAPGVESLNVGAAAAILLAAIVVR